MNNLAFDKLKRVTLFQGGAVTLLLTRSPFEVSLL